ncbi:MAG: hypothetical protein AMXMBFR33_51670 [Candidatus Xenobia bacterium]
MRLRALLLLMLILWGAMQAFSEEEDEAVSTPAAPQGLRFQLSEGAPADGGADRVPPAQARPLSTSEAEAVLKRMPPFKVAGQTTEFALREKSQPAPRTGKTVEMPFPPPQAPDRPAVAPKTLEVLRKIPEGAVPLAPQLSVTFNQPMVAVTSHAELASQTPVKLTPQPPGNWRWVGTQTILFDPRGGSSVKARFPMSTDYRIEVPAGTKSASGQALSSAVSWSFQTPTVQIESSSPSSGHPQPLDPLMHVTLNQDIDPAAVLASIKLSADGQPSLPLRAATTAEIEKAGLKDLPANRRVIFKAVSPLVPATNYAVTMGPGTPSLEGPLKTTSAQTFGFRTYDMFKVVEARCGWNDNCPPLTPFVIEFNNPIDVKKFKPSMVSVSPELPRMKIDASGGTLVIRGESKGRTTYSVRLSSELPDSFGQRLEKEELLTFKVGSANPTLINIGGQLAVLDPYGPPSYSVYCINHQSLKVKIHAVTPEDWSEFSKRLASETHKTPFVSPGQRVFDGNVPTGARPDELTEVRIDLKSALKEGRGMAVVVVEPAVQPKEDYRRQRIVTWVQVTELGLDAANDATILQGWVNSLKDGQPVSGASLTLLDVDGKPVAKGETGADGLARLQLGANAPLLVARKGADTVMLPQQANYWGYANGWRASPQSDSISWFVVDDRKMYRPAETVHLKGWLRRYGAGPTGDVSPLKGEVTKLSYTVDDSRGNEILKGETPVTTDGGFDLKLDLPKTPNLGHARVELSASPASGLSGSTYSHGFQIQEFRRPEFEVSASADPSSSIVGSSAVATVAARYYAGGGLAGAPVSWSVSSSPGSYTPPGRSEYSFGTWTPWWGWGWEGRYYSRPGHSTYKSFQAVTDSAGVHHLKMDFQAMEPPAPTVVRAEASVTDVNRQAWNASTSVLVHPSDLYLGLKTPRSFVEKGQPIELEVLACDREGKAVAGRPIEVLAYRQDYEVVEGEYRPTRTDVQKQSVVSSSGAPSKLSFQTPAGGTYKLEVRGTDEQGRANLSELTVWVAGGKRPPERKVEQEQVTLIPNQKEFRAGDVAEILVQAPFYPAEGVMTLRRSGLLSTKTFRMEGPSTILKVPIEEGYVPNLYVQVDLVGAAERPPSKRPAYAVGSLNLPVPPYARTLKVAVQPAHPATEPGAQTSLEVRITDPAGQGVAGAEVALFVVDEAVLSLTGYQFPDPLNVFYGQRGAGVSDFHLRQYVLLAELDQLQQAVEEKQRDGRMNGGVVPMPAAAPAARRAKSEALTSAEMADDEGRAGKDKDASSPIAVRTDFNPLALFAPVVRTDASGKASVPFKLPDNLTRYRIVALAARGRDFGKGEAGLVARLPLMVRPSPPRFANFGDRFELPVVLQNQTDRPLEVQVAARSSNASLTAATGYALKVPANNRLEVRFPTATEQAGRAAFQVGAVSGIYADAAEFNLPVWTPATSEAFATYGVIDEGSIAQPVKTPGAVFPQFGGLDVTTTSTAVQELTDAVLYLVRYPFDCSEQVSSRLLAIAALKDVLTAFKTAQMPDPAALKAGVDQDIERLRLLQAYNGGFGFWNTSAETWPYLSVHVAHSLVRAREKGFKVPDDMLNRSSSYLKQIESHIPGWYGPDARRAIIAYALYVRHRMKDSDYAKARWLIADAGGVDKLPMEAVGWILYVMSKDPGSAQQVQAIRAFLNNRVTETASTAHFVTSYNEDSGWLVLASDRRVDGIMLEALIEDQPKNDIIPKLVRGLLSHRKAGHWLNTQENCFVLLALDRYFNTYEKITPDFVARVWLGDKFAGEAKFAGRQIERQNIRVPMSYLEGKGTQNLILSKTGAGRLYYRLGMEYAPRNLKLDPADHGFAVERIYEGVDSEKDVSRDAEGVWHVKAGSRVRVRLTMAAPSRRYHVALVDPMPAGLEALNPALAVTGSVPADPKARGAYWWWMSTWYEHQNMRDERVEAFASLLWAGVYEYSYVARATTPGNFVVPPARAEEMYAPETFGRSASDRVIVE